MAEKDPTLLTLNDVQYRLALVIQNAKSGPKIAVKEEELHKPEDTAAVAAYAPNKDTANAADTIFFKQNGKFHILAGQGYVDAARARTNYKGEVFGRLISSVSLKNAKVVEAQPEPEPVKPAPGTVPYNSQFANRPRFGDDDRNSRYANPHARFAHRAK